MVTRPSIAAMTALLAACVCTPAVRAATANPFPYTISDGKQTIPTWKKTNPSLDDAPTTWDLIIGLAETGQAKRAWELFDSMVAPDISDPRLLLSAQIAICSSSGDTTGALQRSLQVNEIRKRNNTGKKDRFGFDLSEFNYRIDGQMVMFYTIRKMYAEAAQVSSDTLTAHSETVNRLSGQISDPVKRSMFLGEQAIITGNYYEELGLTYEGKGEYDRAIFYFGKFAECADLITPPASDDARLKRIKEMMPKAAAEYIDRVRQKRQTGRGKGRAQ